MKKIVISSISLLILVVLVISSFIFTQKVSAQISNVDNTFIMFDDYLWLDRVKLSNAFYAQYPGDQYDFLYFFYDEDSGSGADFVPVKSSKTFLSSIQRSFDNTQLYGSSGKLLGVVIDHASLTNLDRGGFIDTLFFGILQHELFHYWGTYLPQALDDARCDNEHWVGYMGSRISCGGDSNDKFIERSGSYYYYKNCVGIPKFHDFELYSMGLKSLEDVREKVVIYNSEKDFLNDLKVNSDCEKITNVPREYILKSYSIQDFIDILGPSIGQSKNNFNIAFILVKPLGSIASNDEVKSLNWWANKAPIAWYKATEGLSTLNNKIPNNNIKPTVSNVEIVRDSSQIRVSWQTDRPSISAISLKNTVFGYTNIVYRSTLSPPEYSKNHLIIVNSDDDTNISHYGTKDFIIEKLISVDEYLNVGTHDPTISQPPTMNCYVWNMNLQLGSTGPDVVALQTFLEHRGYLVMPSDSSKGYFGYMTYQAVIQYQIAKGISATGFVGPLTRAILNSDCGGIVSQPSITVLSPNGGESYIIGNSLNTALSIPVKWSSSGLTNKPEQALWVALKNEIGGVCNIGSISSYSQLMNIGIYTGYLCPSTGWAITPGRYKVLVYAQNDATIRDESDDYFTIKSVVSAVDTTPPSTPTNAIARLEYGNNIRFSWNASTDPKVFNQTTSGIAGYRVYRDNNLRETTTSLSSYDDFLPPGTTFCWSVEAYDNAGNVSPRTTNSCVTTSASQTNHPPTINGIKGPSTLRVGETGTWEISASDPEGKRLIYSVDWGIPGMITTASSDGNNQATRFNRAYTMTGNYKVTFTVRDDIGQSAQSSFVVKVESVTVQPPSPTITLSAVNSGPDYDPRPYTVTWSTTNADSCVLTIDSAEKGSDDFDVWSGYIGPVAVSGNISASVSANVTLTLTCKGSGGSTTKNVSMSGPQAYNNASSMNAAIWDAIKQWYMNQWF